MEETPLEDMPIHGPDGTIDLDPANRREYAKCTKCNETYVEVLVMACHLCGQTMCLKCLRTCCKENCQRCNKDVDKRSMDVCDRCGLYACGKCLTPCKGCREIRGYDVPHPSEWRPYVPVGETVLQGENDEEEQAVPETYEEGDMFVGPETAIPEPPDGLEWTAIAGEANTYQLVPYVSADEVEESDDESAYLRGRDYECPYCFTPNPGGSIGELTYCDSCENYYPCMDDNDTGHDY
jgi:hypothetical protein